MKLILSMILLLSVNAWSQNDGPKKTIVAVLPLDAIALATQESKSDNAQTNPFDTHEAIVSFAEAVTQKIVDGFVNVKRVRVVERTALDKILREQNFQMTDFSKPNESVKIGELLGAQYILQGQLQQVSVSPYTSATGAGYTSTIDVSLRLINVSDGEITASKNLHFFTGFIVSNTPMESVYLSLKRGEQNIAEWLRSVFPAEGFIFEIKKAKKGEAKVVIITCGSEQGVHKGDKFKIYVETELDLDGRKVKRSSDVGKLEVTKLEQDGIFATCDVDDGGKEIADKIAAGMKLKVVQIGK
jgi:TolB-like protein